MGEIKKCKILYAIADRTLERKFDEFMESHPDIELTDVQYHGGWVGNSIMIFYKIKIE